MAQKKITRLRWLNRMINLCFLFLLGSFFLGYKDFLLHHMNFFIQEDNLKIYSLYFMILIVTFFKLKLEKKIKKLETKLYKKSLKKKK